MTARIPIAAGDQPTEGASSMFPSKRTLVDLADRVGATFAQGFLAALTIGSITDAHALELAGIAGGYAVAKYLLVKANAYLDQPEATKA